MKILIAPDSFKGTMSSLEVINHIEEVARGHFNPLEVVKVPIADGGEGTVQSLVTASKGQYRKVEVMDPLGRKIWAEYGLINENIAVIEMAGASGLLLLSKKERNPLMTTTYGTGQMIKAALDEGIREFIIGIGGSATNDGGIGAAQALGVRMLDKEGREVGFGGRELIRIKKIDLSNMDPRIKRSKITVICDVNNPLTGERGATAVYGPQKGAVGEVLSFLEEGMESYRMIIKQQLGLDMNEIAGSGAAGGLGAALIAFFGASLRPGIETILDIIDFEHLLEGVDLVITGEGMIDQQSAYGKVPVGVASRCKKKGISVVAVSGVMGDNAQQVYDYGIDSIMTTVNKDMTITEAMDQAETLLKDAVDRMFRLIKIGSKINIVK
jgi:glycerate 2-kinase